MSFSNRILLKWYLVDFLKINLSVLVGSCLFWIILLFITGESTPFSVLLTLWSLIGALLFGLYTIVFLWNSVYKNVSYHREVARSKIGKSLYRFLIKPQNGQADDLLKDALFMLDWMPLSAVKKHLEGISNKHVSVRLDDKTWDHIDKILRPAPQLTLILNGQDAASIYLYK